MFTKIMEETAIKAQENAVRGETDYIGNDGLLFCGNCHTAKQVQVKIFGEVRTPFCMCNCETEKYNAEQERFKAMQEAIEINRLRSIGIQDQRILSYNFSNDDGRNPKILDLAKRYAEHFEEIKANNCGLLMYGEPGTGKSFYAGCIGNALIDRGYSVLASNITELQNKLFSADDKNEILRELCRFDLLVLDDLGAERNTDYSIEQVYSVIDKRYKSNKPVIATTNHTPQTLLGLTDVQHQRIYDRIFEMCTPVEVKGRKRMELGKKKIKTLSEILYGGDSGEE